MSHVSSDLKYLFVNQSYADWFGLPRGKIVGRHISEILSPEGYKGSQPCINKVLSGEKATFNLAVQRNGQSRALDIAFIPQLDEHGEVQSYYTITQDITDRRQSEDALRKKTHEKALLLDNIELSDLVFNRYQDIRFCQQRPCRFPRN
jgi:PAS domain S-box-containing protein